MPLLVVLWLAVLHGFVPTARPAWAASARLLASGRVAATRALPERPEEHPVPHAVRARPASGLAAARLVMRSPPGAAEGHRPPFALGAGSLRRHDRAGAAAAARRVLACELSHVADARGGHLPYFPTAPPLQG